MNSLSKMKMKKGNMKVIKYRLRPLNVNKKLKCLKYLIVLKEKLKKKERYINLI